MSKNIEYHFVVAYDCSNDSFYVDYETRSALFSDGPVYEIETDTWRLLEENEWAEDGTLYDRASDALYSAIEKIKLLKEKQ